MLEENFTSENRYIAEVKRALLREGFWGRPVRKLAEELRDHFSAKTEALEAQGHSLPEARRMTATALGEPKAIAIEWSRTLQSKSWIARHPWLTGAIGICGIWVFTPLLWFIGFHLSGMHDYAYTHRLRFLPDDGWYFLANWTVWIGGMFLLAWKAVRSSNGWAPLLAECLALGLATSAFAIDAHLPTQGPGTGSIIISGETWMTVCAYPLLGHLPHYDLTQQLWRISQCGYLFKLLFPPLACLAAREIVPRLRLDSAIQ